MFLAGRPQRGRQAPESAEVPRNDPPPPHFLNSFGCIFAVSGGVTPMPTVAKKPWSCLPLSHQKASNNSISRSFDPQDQDWTFPWVVAHAAAKTEVKNAKSSREIDKTLILHYIDGREEELDRRIHQRMSKTALYGFILDDNLPMTEKLLREFPELLNEQLVQSNGSTPTLIAAEKGKLECLRLLIASRSDVRRALRRA